MSYKFNSTLLDKEYNVDSIISNNHFVILRVKKRNDKRDDIFTLKCLNVNSKNAENNELEKFIGSCETIISHVQGSSNILQMRNPHIIQGSTEEEKVAVVEMDLVEGKTIDKFIEDVGNNIDIKEFYHFLLQAGCALSFCHQHQVIHNDIHGNNFMRTNQGKYLLLDFDTSLFEGKPLDKDVQFAGAGAFTAPEKDNESAVTMASDIYSFGILALKVLTGQQPNKNKIAEKIDTLIATSRNDCPDWIKTVLKKCIRENPQERYSNAYAMMEDVLENLAIDATKKLEDTREDKNNIKKLEKKIDENNLQIYGQAEEIFLLKTELQDEKDKHNKSLERLQMIKGKCDDLKSKLDEAIDRYKNSSIPSLRKSRNLFGALAFVFLIASSLLGYAYLSSSNSIDNSDFQIAMDSLQQEITTYKLKYTALSLKYNQKVKENNELKRDAETIRNYYNHE